MVNFTDDEIEKALKILKKSKASFERHKESLKKKLIRE